MYVLDSWVDDLLALASKVKMGHILPKQKNAMANFFEYSIVSDKLPKN